MVAELAEGEPLRGHEIRKYVFGTGLNSYINSHIVYWFPGLQVITARVTLTSVLKQLQYALQRLRASVSRIQRQESVTELLSINIKRFI